MNGLISLIPILSILYTTWIVIITVRRYRARQTWRRILLMIAAIIGWFIPAIAAIWWLIEVRAAIASHAPYAGMTVYFGTVMAFWIMTIGYAIFMGVLAALIVLLTSTGPLAHAPGSGGSGSPLIRIVSAPRHDTDRRNPPSKT